MAGGTYSDQLATQTSLWPVSLSWQNFLKALSQQNAGFLTNPVFSQPSLFLFDFRHASAPDTPSHLSSRSWGTFRSGKAAEMDHSPPSTSSVHN
jgi:hypothetical protein